MNLPNEENQPQFDLPLPTTPEPEFPLPQSHGSPAWRIAVVMVGLLAFVVFRAVSLPTTANEREETRRIDGQIAALRSTKIAYAYYEAPQAGSITITSSNRRKKPEASRRGAPSASLAENSSGRLVKDALADWRKLADAKDAHAPEIRRYGITLAAFGEPDALKVLHRIASLPPPAPSAKKSDKSQKSKTNVDNDPVTIPRRQEDAFWEVVYGPEKLTPAQVPALRKTLKDLHLNWFENLAAESLYAKAGMTADAKQAHERAAASPRMMLLLTTFQTGVGLLGLLGGLGWIVAYIASPRPIITIRGARSPFRPEALLLAFVAYLAFWTLGPLSLHPLFARLRDLPDDVKYRVNMGFMLLLDGIVILLVIAVLRRLTSRELSFRGVFARLGFRAKSVPAEFKAAVVALAVSYPLVAIASVISNALFSKYSTPQNPVTLFASAPNFWDKLFIFVEASVLAPIIEEMTFRGLLYPALRAKRGPLVAAVLTSCVFAFAHPDLPAGFLPLWTLGMVMALLYEWRGSLVPGIFLHGLHNGLVMLIYFATFARG